MPHPLTVCLKVSKHQSPTPEYVRLLCLIYSLVCPSITIHSFAPTFNESPSIWWGTHADTIAFAPFHARLIRAWIMSIRSVYDRDVHAIQIHEWEMRRKRKGLKDKE